MGVLNRIGTALGFSAHDPGGDAVPAHAPTDDFWYGPISLGNGAGVHVTPDTAVKAAAVFACVSKIAKTIAMLPYHMHEEGADGSRTRAHAHYLDKVISLTPNNTHTAVEFWEIMLWHALTRGVAYAEIIGGATTPVEKLLILPPDAVTPKALGRDKWAYKVRQSDGTERTLLQREVFRFAGPIRGGVAGMGICETASEVLATTLAADQYAARTFSNNLNVGGVVEHPGALSPEAAAQFIKTFEMRAAGIMNAHRPILLQEGAKYTSVTQKATDMQLLEARKWQALEICRIFDMPPSMIGIDQGDTRTSYEEQSINFARYTLQPNARRIEQATARDLIATENDGTQRFKAKFNFNALLRGNQRDRAEYNTKALGSGGAPAWASVNEIRRNEGLNPLDGDEYNLPAIGTNPRQDELVKPKENAAAKALPAPETKALTPPDENSYEGRCKRLIGKELKILRRNAEKSGGEYERWLSMAQVFYGSHVSFVMETMQVDKENAKAYCGVMFIRVKNSGSIAGGVAYLENEALADLMKVNKNEAA
jgi:HK97 family phage portal protein